MMGIHSIAIRPGKVHIPRVKAKTRLRKKRSIKILQIVMMRIQKRERKGREKEKTHLSRRAVTYLMLTLQYHVCSVIKFSTIPKS